MWLCINCDKIFQMSDNFVEKTCPFCESEKIQQATGFFKTAEFNNSEELYAELSFNDIDLHELLLIDLPIEDVVPVTYITEMSKRFLHTFIDGCFIPA